MFISIRKDTRSSKGFGVFLFLQRGGLVVDTDAFSSNKESDNISDEPDGDELYYKVKKLHTYLSVDRLKNKCML